MENLSTEFNDSVSVGREKTQKKILFISIVIALSLLGTQLTGSKPLIAIPLIAFYALVTFAPLYSLLPVFLFFLPWASLLKLQPEKQTAFSLAIIIFFVRLFLPTKENKITGGGTIDIKALMYMEILTVLCIFAKMLWGYPIKANFVRILMLMFVVPAYLKKYSTRISFKWCTVFIACGTMLASYLAIAFADYPNISRYISIDEIVSNEVTRYAGFSGDPNTYSMLSLAAISCILIMLVTSKGGKYQILGYSCVLLLIYQGLVSISKMFVLLLAILIFLWLWTLPKVKGKAYIQLFAVVFITAGILIAFSTDWFDGIYSMYLARMKDTENLNDLTTGRAWLQKSYLSFFYKHPLKLIIGQGISAQYDVGLGHSRASHNTLIQLVYEYGLFGVGVFIFWFKYSAGNILEKREIPLKGMRFALVLIMVVGCFGAWPALDLMFKDAFFYYITLFFVALKYICDYEEEKPKRFVQKYFEGGGMINEG
ncbi:MAG: O-antigen ligase family protein [Bacillota bacterium]|nr:O-antigen ligase family protein [Bacillota bacterium]